MARSSGPAPSVVSLLRRLLDTGLAHDAVAFYHRHRADLKRDGIVDEIEEGLAHQNRNPVKRLRLVGDADGDHAFDDSRRYAALGNDRAMCIDYSVGKRWQERRAPGFDGRFQTRLAALRNPENVLVFDDGESVRMD